MSHLRAIPALTGVALFGFAVVADASVTCEELGQRAARCAGDAACGRTIDEAYRECVAEESGRAASAARLPGFLHGLSAPRWKPGSGPAPRWLRKLQATAERTQQTSDALIRIINLGAGLVDAWKTAGQSLTESVSPASPPRAQEPEPSANSRAASA